MKKLLLVGAALSLTACSTVKMPNLSGLTDFRNEKIRGDYPDVSEAPEEPVDVRSAAEWDQAAVALKNEKRKADITDETIEPTSPAEFNRKFEQLKQEVRAYKADDPVE